MGKININRKEKLPNNLPDWVLQGHTVRDWLYYQQGKRDRKNSLSAEEIRGLCLKDKLCKEKCKTYKLCFDNNLVCKSLIGTVIHKRIKEIK